MAFDIAGARKAGYSDDEITDYLAADKGVKFDVSGAQKAGYSPAEIIDFIGAQKPDAKGFFTRAKDAVTKLYSGDSAPVDENARKENVREEKLRSDQDYQARRAERKITPKDRAEFGVMAGAQSGAVPPEYDATQVGFAQASANTLNYKKETDSLAASASDATARREKPGAMDYVKAVPALATDTANVLNSGLAGIAEMSGMAMRYGGMERAGKVVQDIGHDAADYWRDAMTSEGKTALGGSIINDDLSVGNTPVLSTWLQSINSLPSMGATMAIGGPLRKVVVEGSSFLLTKAGAPALTELAKRPDIIGKIAGLLPTSVALGAAEGGVAALQNASSIEYEIENISLKDIRNSPYYARLFEATDAGLSVDQREIQVRSTLARMAANDVAWKTLVSTGGIGILTGGGALGAISRKSKGPIKSTAMEAIQETPQSGAEYWIQNVAKKKYIDPSIDVTEGVIGQGLSGGVVGVATGGAIGSAGAIKNAIVNSPERQIAREINRNVEGIQFTGANETARASLNPQKNSISPMQTVRPQDAVGPSNPAPGVTPATVPIPTVADIASTQSTDDAIATANAIIDAPIQSSQQQLLADLEGNAGMASNPVQQVAATEPMAVQELTQPTEGAQIAPAVESLPPAAALEQSAPAADVSPDAAISESDTPAWKRQLEYARLQLAAQGSQNDTNTVAPVLPSPDAITASVENPQSIEQSATTGSTPVAQLDSLQSANTAELGNIAATGIPAASLSVEQPGALTSIQAEIARIKAQQAAKLVPVEPVAEQEPADRRQDTQERKRVRDMSIEEARQELLIDDMTGLGNKRAYNENVKKPHQASIDIDSLKWVNDNMGHESGDQLIKAVGQALQEESVDAYHLSGDEFAVQFDDEKSGHEILARVRTRLKDAVFTYTLEDGSVITKKGAELSYGISDNYDAADQRLKADKKEREARGERVGRGEEPAGVVRKPATGRETDSNAAAEEIDQPSEQDASTTNATDEGGVSTSDANDAAKVDSEAKTKEILDRANILGKERLEAQSKVRSGEYSIADLDAAYPAKVEPVTATEKKPEELPKEPPHGNAPTPFSKGEKSADTHTVESFRASMSDALNGLRKGLAGLLNHPNVNIITDSQIPESVIGSRNAYEIGGKAYAYVDPDTGTINFIADNIPKNWKAEQLVGLAKHEIAVHALQMGRGSVEFKSILASMEAMRKDGNNAVVKAYNNVPNDTQENLIPEEALGYLVQTSPTLSLVQKFKAWMKQEIRAFAKAMKLSDRVQFVEWAGKLTDADLNYMAERALIGAMGAMEVQGQPLFSRKNQTDTPEFKQWFGDSKVVDADGKPLVVYHGTAKDFDSFDNAKTGANDRGLWGTGHYFAASSESANSYALREGGGARIIPAYVSMKNPLILKTGPDLVTRLPDGTNSRELVGPNLDGEKIKAIAKAGGHDGVIQIKPDGLIGDLVAYNPTQIKSAIGNNGNFDGKNSDIRFSKPPSIPAGHQIPEETGLEGKRRIIQDKFNRFKTLQRDLEVLTAKNAGFTGDDIHKARAFMSENNVANPIRDDSDVYQAETLMSGKISTRKEDFRDRVMKPLIEKTHKAGFEMRQVGDFLKMQHVPEANKRAREIHNDPDATAYGITDARAAKEMADLKALPNFDELEKISNEWRSITEQSKKILLDAGLISKDIANAWDATYSVYVPVKGAEQKPGQGQGQGLSVNGRQKRRLGHSERDEAILENILRDHERAISNEEINNVGMVMLRFGLEAQNPDIMTHDKPAKRQVLKDSSAYEVLYVGGTVAAFTDKASANAFVQSDAAKNSRDIANYNIEKTSNPFVALMVSPMLAENEATVYVAGHAVRVQINDEIAARAYKNLGVEGLGTILSAGREVNSWFSKVYTGYSPDFILTNPIRDAIQGAVTLTGEYGALMAGKIYLRYPRAALELLRHFKTPGSSPLVTDYRANGGSTGAAYLSDLERIGNDIMASYDEYAGAMKTYQRVHAEEIAKGSSETKAHTYALAKAGASKFKGIPVVGHILRFMERVNSITENALRVATYKTLVDKGVSKPKAAAQAKNLMNFNRKGELSNQAGALYLFFNPNVQGTSILMETLGTSKHRVQARALAGSMVALAYIIAEVARSGGDDEEKKWKQTPTHVKDGNMVFGAGDDHQITITMPYGYRVFHTLGNVMSDYAHGEDGYKLGIRMASAMLSNFSPVGNPLDGESGAVSGVVSVLPTIAKVAVGPTVNQDSFSRPITPKKWKDSTPDSQLMNRKTKGTLYASIAETTNSVTGGSKFEKGAVDVSPETLRFWVKTLTGGAGQFAFDTINLPTMFLAGAPPDPKDIPIVRRFVREIGVSDARGAFWEKANEVKAAAGAFADARKAHDGMAARKIFEENKALISLGNYLNSTQSMVKAKRDEIDRIRLDDNLSLEVKIEKMKVLEQRETAIYNKFLDAFDSRKAAVEKKIDILPALKDGDSYGAAR